MTPEVFLNGRVLLYAGDCLDVLKEIPDISIDSCVTDPPYHLTSIVKRFGAENAAPAKVGKTGAYARASAGFMGKQWDGGDIAFRPEVWCEVLRVLKPGGHLLAFSGTRTYHRMVTAIYDSGFEVRDQIAWVFGQGFPKSHNAGNGWGTALKPAWEPICLARKPLIGTVAENVTKYGTGAINIDGCRVSTQESLYGGAYAQAGHRNTPSGDERIGAALGMFQPGKTVGEQFEQPIGRWPANIIHDGSDEVVQAFPDAPGQQRFVGPEHGLRPSRGIYGDFGERPPSEPRGDSGSAARFFYRVKQDETCHFQKSANDVVAYFSLQSEVAVSALSSAVAQSMRKSELQDQSFRAQNTNVSDKELRIICEAATEMIQNIERRFSLGLPQENITATLGPVMCVAIPKLIGITTIILSLSRLDHYAEVVTFDIIEKNEEVGVSDCGKRFYYSNKADADDRVGSKHPTVKPLDLMQYLCRLVTPTGGTVLDPFSGTGTTGEAAFREGFRAVLIEREAEYIADIRRRMALVMAGPEERARESIKEKLKGKPLDAGPLFRDVE